MPDVFKFLCTLLVIFSIAYVSQIHHIHINTNLLIHLFIRFTVLFLWKSIWMTDFSLKKRWFESIRNTRKDSSHKSHFFNANLEYDIGTGLEHSVDRYLLKFAFLILFIKPLYIVCIRCICMMCVYGSSFARYLIRKLL